MLGLCTYHAFSLLNVYLAVIGVLCVGGMVMVLWANA